MDGTDVFLRIPCPNGLTGYIGLLRSSGSPSNTNVVRGRDCCEELPCKR